MRMKLEQIIKQLEVLDKTYDPVAPIAIREACRALKEYQRLKADRKVGHWVRTNDYVTCAYGTLDYYECSCCGEDSLEEGDYCPNCGAKMIEPQESEG